MNILNKVIFVFLLAFIQFSTASEKKGVGLADLQASDRIESLNVAWYYTWKPLPINGVAADKFVPMIWGGAKERISRQFSRFQSDKKLPVLLGFNEPNKKDQSNMSVNQAIRLWPKLAQLTERLGSPAPAGVLTSWFDRFYRIAKQKKLKLDFMAVHWYGPPDAKKFLAKIDRVYQKYRLPIWITEFAVADWKAKNKPGTNQFSDTQVLAFMRTVLPELEKRDYVERYAWFGAGKHSLTHEQVRTSRLFEKNGDLTPLGKFYADFR